MRRLVYRPAALDDLDAIFELIEPDSLVRARHFVDDIWAGCRKLSEYPQLGPARGDLGAGIRVLALRGRVVVAYRVRAEVIEVVRVFYGGQDYEAILQNEDRRPE
jgi:toxin ParE1/3/4